MNKIPNYRVWHKIEKRFVDLRSIDFEKDSIGYDCYREANYYDVAKFDEIVFQQWTGEYDKNKKRIYEGDIIKYTRLFEKERRIVELFSFIKFQDAKFGFDLTGFNDMFFDLSDEPDFEVVGNIFQLPCNPDHNGECLVCDCWLSDCQFLNKENKE